jgi:hypothetical protein
MNEPALMKCSAAQHFTPCVANNLQKLDAEGKSRCMNIAIPGICFNIIGALAATGRLPATASRSLSDHSSQLFLGVLSNHPLRELVDLC